MEVYWIQWFHFSAKYYADNSEHKHYHTVKFSSERNIQANIWLTLFSPGIDLPNNVIGIAAAGVHSYRHINENGDEVLVKNDTWISFAQVRRCLEITFAFHIVKAWAKAEGLIFHWND